MSSNSFSNAAFQQAPSIGFNLVTQTNSFTSVFDFKPLDKEEASHIEKLLVDNFQPGSIPDEQVERDTVELKQITAEIKSIGRQGIVLMGERVHRASEILKPYKDGTFTKWLESAFGSRKTGYNMLNYYTLYNELPTDDLRQKFKKIPQRTAYMLASRSSGSVETKAEIIDEYHDRSHKELAILIQEKLPLASDDKRMGKNSNERLISAIRDALKKLQSRKDDLTASDKKELSKLLILLNPLCDPA